MDGEEDSKHNEDNDNQAEPERDSEASSSADALDAAALLMAAGWDVSGYRIVLLSSREYNSIHEVGRSRGTCHREDENASIEPRATRTTTRHNMCIVM